MKRKPFLACMNCRFLVPRRPEVTRCPRCGSTDLTENWEGMIILIKTDSELVGKVEYLKEPGRYAVEVGRE
ncbi:transcription elongation factor subunit Spt4 [Ignicoccus hospitalis]|uniref:Transcription elongation factor Spt4 n=1 Tax=Ignicoccus hospitalis (strain KIN4/I / DSM 18386 / JCM 14125) TaxID=453591 RepID=A8A8L5_IGNH4|nr:transcription elongation factor subunit Spt4 [Ignicoccus hospitalis]ABU81267.1 DNA-directed RNA polymerase, subunit E'' [Ignicoccus hospitalis KIN4/I]HIH90949.1 DNA-binding protein [Desulfurococcaceae archaeon]